jgi:AraC-like DNA-binding protein
MRRVAPSPALSPFVCEIMLVDVESESIRLRLPEPGLVLGIRHQGRADLVESAATTLLPDATLTGISNIARKMRTSAGGKIALVRFHPGGAARFFAEPLHEIYGSTVALGDLVRQSEVERVRSQLVEAKTDVQRASALERFLLARLRGPADPIVDAAVRAIRDTDGAVRIDALAGRLSISVDALEKRFRRAVGASPKQLASLLRLRGAVDGYKPGMRLAALAAEAGYFDQSHFNRELRAATGQSPKVFFESGEYR